METHNKLLSILHICYGSFLMVIFLIMSLFMNSFMPFILENVEVNSNNDAEVVSFVFSAIQSLVTILILVVAIPALVGGFGFLNHRKWGLNIMMISGCLSLLSVPIGTALGVYTIWVYLENNKKNNNDQN